MSTILAGIAKWFGLQLLNRFFQFLLDLVAARRRDRDLEELGALKQREANRAEQDKTLQEIDRAADDLKEMSEEERLRKAME